MVQGEKGAPAKTERAAPVADLKQSGGTNLGSDLGDKKTKKTPIPKFLVKKPRSTMMFDGIVRANGSEDESKESKKSKVGKIILSCHARMLDSYQDCAIIAMIELL